MEETTRVIDIDLAAKLLGQHLIDTLHLGPMDSARVQVVMDYRHITGFLVTVHTKD